MNRNKPIAAIAAAVCLTPLVAAQPDAETVMAGVLARYAELETYSHIATQEMDIDFGDGGMMMGGQPETRSRFAWDDAGRFALVGGEFVDYYADGQSAITHAEPLHEYTRTATDARAGFDDFDSIYARSLVGEHYVASILIGGELPEDSMLALAGTGEVTELDNGDTRITFAMALEEGAKMDAWLTIDADSGLISRVELDLLAMIKLQGAPGGPQPERARRIVEYAEIKTDLELADAVFVFRPDENDQLVDALPDPMQIMQAKMGGMGMGMGEPERDGGAAAPGIKATTLDGEPFDLAELKGKVVLIDFWATWCKPCMMAMPGVVAVHERYKDKGLVVVGINMDVKGKLDKVREVMKASNITFIQIHDEDGAIAKSFGVTGIPHTALIDKTGMITNTHIGYNPEGEKQLAEEIEALLDADI